MQYNANDNENHYHLTQHTKHRKNIMAMNPYELRYSLLRDAKDMLTNRWHQDFEYEMRLAEVEKRKPNPTPHFTAEEVRRLAAELYEFVQDKT